MVISMGEGSWEVTGAWEGTRAWEEWGSGRGRHREGTKCRGIGGE